VLDLSFATAPLIFSQEEETEVDCVRVVGDCRHALYGVSLPVVYLPFILYTCMNFITLIVTWLSKDISDRQQLSVWRV